MTDVTRSVVNRYFQAYRERQPPEAIAALFSEDVDWNIPGDTSRVPWIGRKVGRAGVADFVRGLRERVESLRFEVRSVLVDGEHAVALGELATRVNSTGKVIESPFTFEFTVRNGLITKYLMLEDSFAVREAVLPDIEARRKIVENYFRWVDAGDPRLFDLFTDDVEFFFPKFGRGRGKDAIRRFRAAFEAQIAELEHDIAGLHYIASDAGDFIVVEGQERGVTRDGAKWPDGTINEGRFCDVFQFEGALIRRTYIYVDPDFTNADDSRVKALRATL
ncbi:nuclear transport factor 2 family protein [Pendulispora rubella]|uniref:Nuclear transport factor 2 family protein n=1 Tax=Pendulispora rubella TaxID=2741070 RepID=A0ABZ2KWI3_9BACT